MAHRKTRKSRTSKGIHGSPSKVGKKDGMARLLNQLDAYLKGKNTRVTVEGKESNRAFHKVDGSELFAVKGK